MFPFAPQKTVHLHLEKPLNTQLTPQILATFVGGQMEIQNQSEGYVYRGELKKLTIDDKTNELKAEFVWLGKGDGFPPTSWKKDDRVDYAASLDIFSIRNIGPSQGEGGDRWCLMSNITGETVMLFPSDGNRLDPAHVEGLELTSA